MLNLAKLLLQNGQGLWLGHAQGKLADFKRRPGLQGENRAGEQERKGPFHGEVFLENSPPT
ncbi:hypothetical protein D3C80_2052490 [compost metagenome]